MPYGFENMQSSRDRLPLDRTEALDTAVPGERDLGVFFMWAPTAKTRALQKDRGRGPEGIGDYGIVAIGVYNGQGLNRPEANDFLHTVARVTWPIEAGSQIVEPGVQGYIGEYKVTADQRSADVKGTTGFAYDEARVAGSLVLYPKPFGVQAEYNFGHGPEYSAATDSIETMDLSGGYVTLSYRLKVGEHVIFPFARGQVYDGARKTDLDARAYEITDYEFGVEWQPIKYFELTVEYYIGDHEYSNTLIEDDHQTGNLLRVQAQVSF